MNKPKNVPYTGVPIVEGVECFIGCPCGRCQQIRAAERVSWLATTSPAERLVERLASIARDDPLGAPARAMFNVADVQAVVDQLRPVTAHQQAVSKGRTEYLGVWLDDSSR